MLVNAVGQTKIIDFAISKKIKKGFFANLFRKRGAPEGTASYMSPEQIRNELLDGRSDIYSMASAMYEIITGRPPFRGNSVSDLFRKQLSEKPALPSAYNPDVTDEFGKLLLHMLAKKVTDRPKSFHEVLMEMRKTKLFKSVNERDDEEQ
jgi:serine/threonine-protein kinase